MKIPAAKIELAVAKEESRYTLQAVKLDVEEKAMIATDGHILAYVPVETHAEDHSALISLEVMKMIRAIQKQNKVGKSEIPVKVQTNGKLTVESIDSKSEFPLAEGSFVNWQAVKPKMETGAAKLRGELLSILQELNTTPELSERLDKIAAQLKTLEAPIGINAALLLRLTQAISADNKNAIVKLWIKDANSPIGVQASGAEDSRAWGVIMPVRV